MTDPTEKLRILKRGNSYVLLAVTPEEKNMPHPWMLHHLTKGAGISHRIVTYSFAWDGYKPCDDPPEHIRARAIAVRRAIDEGGEG